MLKEISGRVIVILVISHLGFEGWTLNLIASVPGHCLSFTSIQNPLTRLSGDRYGDVEGSHIPISSIFLVSSLTVRVIAKGKGHC